MVLVVFECWSKPGKWIKDQCGGRMVHKLNKNRSDCFQLTSQNERRASYNRHDYLQHRRRDKVPDGRSHGCQDSLTLLTLLMHGQSHYS